MSNERYLAFFVFLLGIAFSTTVVVNSKNWEDVFYATLYAHNNGYRIFYANSPNPAGLFNILPKDNIIVLNGINSYIPNLGVQLKLKGYVVEREERLTKPYEQLMPKNPSKFYIVEEDFPYLSIPVGALARAENAWVFIVNEDNAPSISKLIDGKEAIQVGKLKRSVKNILDPYIKEKIDVGSKYDIAVEIAKRFLKNKKVNQVYLTEGDYLEPELLKGSSPSLLIGKNLLPNNVMNFLIENKIDTVVLIGPQLTYVGEQIRDKSNKKIAVFIKFGMSTPGASPKIYALNLYPLPKPEIKLKIEKASYDPENKKVYIEFKNYGNVGLFELTTFRILRNGEEIASSGDDEVVFIGAGENIIKSYSVAISDLTGNLTVEFYTAYGDSPENMNSYLTQGGKFAPPYTLPLKIEKTKNRAKIELKDVKYFRDKKAFAIELENKGNVTAYAVVKLLGVKIQGVEQYLSSDVVKIERGAKKYAYIRAKLDEIDESENEVVSIEVDYGERKDLLSKSIREKREVIYTSSGYLVYAGAGVALIAIFVGAKIAKGKRKVRRIKRRK